PIHRQDRRAVGDDVDGKTVIRNRRSLSRKIVNRRIDPDLDALDRAALHPVYHPLADFGNDQGRPYQLELIDRHRRSRDTELQPRLAGIVDATATGDADITIADIGLGQHHAVLLRIDTHRDRNPIEDQRLV